ncbi:MAG: GIY-YIG nuclease family protein [Alphaproteobacteria bacterium]|nr:GIY-YIG nuclease family protein [Alphaproteobacteria bacterium]
MNKQCFVYILTNKPYGTLYIGMTGNITRRIYEHKNKLIDGFTKKYGLDKLVYYEIYDNFAEASLRERTMKAWKRDWKKQLIEKQNRDWRDLSDELI